MGRLDGFSTFDRFGEVANPARYTPLDEDWILGLTDVTSSTEAIANGRYKAVNVAGAAAISAVMNGLGTAQFPFAFAGDGCAFALPERDREAARTALSQTVAWVRDDLGLALRAAIVPVTAARAAGREVAVALYRPSPHVAYAMFDGGGLVWAEAEMKAGRYEVASAPVGCHPNLTGLSCRWLPLASQNGAVVSLIARPGSAGAGPFREAVEAVLTLLEEGPHHPVPVAGPRPAFVSPGTLLEAKASRRGLPLWRRVVAVTAHNLMGWALFLTRLKVGGFDPATYRALASRNADARKFEDALMVTADVSPALEGALRELLDAAALRGALRYGLHRQSAALMTCIVPSYQEDGHYHFVDGAEGGYAEAAKVFREQALAKQPERSDDQAIRGDETGQ